MERLIERETELGRLDTWLDEAILGRGRWVFVAGEAGIGKSTLLEAAVDRAAKRGFRVATGWCEPLSVARALGPFRDIATALGLDPSSDREALLNAIVSVANEPLLVVLEDAHWADEASLELLLLLGRRVKSTSLVLAASYRDDAAGEDLRKLLGDAATGSASAWLTPAALSLGGLVELAAGTGRDAHEIMRMTGGNPFLATECLLVDPSLSTPAVRHSIRSRVAGLPSDTRTLCELAAIETGRVSVGLAAAFVDDPGAAADPAISAGLLVSDVNGLGFRHELARTALLESIPPSRRRQLHAGVVGVLEADRPVDHERVAHHALHAGDDVATAVHSAAAAVLAADQAAHRQTVQHGETALVRSQHLDADTTAAVRLVTAEARTTLGDSRGAVDLFEQSLESAKVSDDAATALRARWGLVLASIRLGDTARAETVARDMERQLTVDAPVSQRVIAGGAMTYVQMLARRPTEARAAGSRAIELARASGDLPRALRIQVDVGVARAMADDAEGITILTDAIESADQIGATAVSSYGRMQLGSGLGEVRRYDLAVPALERAIADSTRYSYESQRQYAAAWLARCQLDLGDWDAAAETARQALTGPPDVLASFVAQITLGLLRARRGDDDTWTSLEHATATADRTGHLQRMWPVAVARLEAGWLAGDASAHVARARAALEMAIDLNHPIAIGDLAVWLRRIGDGPTIPHDAVPRLRPYHRAAYTGEHALAAAAYRALGCHYDAALSMVDARDAEAMRQAATTFDRLGALPMLALVDTALGVQRLRRPGSDPSALTARELEVVRLVAAGFTNPQIADALYISRKTAEHHVSNILMKFGVTTRAEAAALAVRRGLADG